MAETTEGVPTGNTNRKKSLYLILAGVVLLIALVVGIAVPLSKDNNTSNRSVTEPEPAPEPQPESPILPVCVGIRGNAQLFWAHYGALARIVEALGPINGLSGGSSASSTVFITESMHLNPFIVQSQDDPQQKGAYLSFLLKSMEAWSNITTQSFTVENLYPAEFMVNLLQQLQTLDLKNVTQVLEVLKEADAASPLGSVINPEVYQVVAESSTPELHLRDIIEGVNLDFVIEGPAVFIRTGLINWQPFALANDLLASFYAGYEPVNTDLMSDILQQCANDARGLEWPAIITLPYNATKQFGMDSTILTCGEAWTELVSRFLAARTRNSPSRLEDNITSLEATPQLIAFPQVSGLKGDALSIFERARQLYLGGLDFNATQFGQDISFDDVAFGVWGDPVMLELIQKNLRLKYPNDLKSNKFRSLGQTTWGEVLMRSPAEPGFSRGVETGSDFISTGGWADLKPAQLLDAAGCETVVLVDQRGSIGSFQREVARYLGASSNELRSLFDLTDPTSSSSVAIQVADANLCTNWNAISANDVRGLMAEGWFAPLITSRKDIRDRFPPDSPSGEFVGCTPGLLPNPNDIEVPEEPELDARNAAIYTEWLMKINDLGRPLTKEELETLRNLLTWIDGSFPTRSKAMVAQIVTNSSLLFDCEALVTQAVSCIELGQSALKWLYPNGMDGTVDTMDLRKRRLQNEGDGFFSSAVRLVEQAQAFLTAPLLLNYSEYTASPEFPNEDLSSLFKFFDGPLSVPFLPEGRKITRLVTRALLTRSQLTSQVNMINVGATDESFYSSFFLTPPRFLRGLLPDVLTDPRSKVGSLLEDDSAFARSYLIGVNPVMIQLCRDQNILPQEMLDFLAAQNVDVADLIASNRIYYADYSELGILPANPHDSFPDVYYGNASDLNKDGVNDGIELLYFFPSWIVFVLETAEVAGDDDFLDIAAIQLNPPNRDPVVYSRKTSSDAEWHFAKVAIANADSNVHEWVSHLALTHLAVEPLLLSIHNVLRREDHALYDFLFPIGRDTFIINAAARLTLVALGPGSIGDVFSSVGAAQALQLGRNHKVNLTFSDFALPNNLEKRGFTRDVAGPPGYYYREDGLKLWEAIGTFSSAFVDEVYVSDADVANDLVLQEWAFEATDPDRGDVSGFPTTFVDKATLAFVLQTIFWTTSGQHAAMNFGQYDYYGFIPNRPISLEGSESTCSSTGCLFEAVLPNRVATTDVVSTTTTLITETDYPLTGLSQHFASTRYGRQAYAEFLAALRVIGDEIEQRNNDLTRSGKVPYPYLHPDRVPASIDI